MALKIRIKGKRGRGDSMELNLFWTSVLMLLTGTILLRVAGRKSISQMTVAQTVIMISIGSIIIQPIVETSVPNTMIAVSIFIGGLILMEWLQVKFNFIEKFLTGKSVVIVENGQINTKNLKTLRFTVDQLEMRLRQNGVSNIEDLKTATLEPNGQLGYELKREARPVTVGDLEKMLPQLILKLQSNTEEPSIFNEVRSKSHETPHPNRLN
ncbi:DUF421 domain-containing protein [Cytobacillus sp. FJAT-54145]|uniref:DUF421 domain-containing protein n=1 Tax=Cytobacillus spartinae TaxID=3299023 RepID=A0ABW6KER9_9BACI